MVKNLKKAYLIIKTNRKVDIIRSDVTQNRMKETSIFNISARYGHTDIVIFVGAEFYKIVLSF